MPSPIKTFFNSFTDVAKPSRFEVTIGPKTYNNISSSELILRCETAELPSRTYATAEQKFGSNPIEKFPYQVQFNDLNLTFIVDDDMLAKYFLSDNFLLVEPLLVASGIFLVVYKRTCK